MLQFSSYCIRLRKLIVDEVYFFRNVLQCSSHCIQVNNNVNSETGNSNDNSDKN